MLIDQGRFKFRVWDTKIKQFVDKIAPLKQWLDTDVWDDSEDLLEDPYIYPNNVIKTFDGRFIWQQWTGLKDQNRIDVYEGDILSDGYKITEIRYSKAYSGFQFCEHMLGDNEPLDFYGGVSPEYSSIIGHIFEEKYSVNRPT